MRQVSLENDKDCYKLSSEPHRMDVGSDECYNIHIQSAIDHKEKEALKEMVERAIKASLQ